MEFCDKFLICDSKFLDFAYGEASGHLSTREVLVENVSIKRMSLFWTHDSGFHGSKDNVFDITPASANINPGQAVKFTITFRPNKASAFFFQKVQCFGIDYESNTMEKISKASFAMKKRMVEKSNINHSNIKDELESSKIIPPIELSVVCTGNSFGADQ